MNILEIKVAVVNKGAQMKQKDMHRLALPFECKLYFQRQKEANLYI